MEAEGENLLHLGTDPNPGVGTGNDLNDLFTSGAEKFLLISVNFLQSKAAV